MHVNVAFIRFQRADAFHCMCTKRETYFLTPRGKDISLAISGRGDAEGRSVAVGDEWTLVFGDIDTPSWELIGEALGDVWKFLRFDASTPNRNASVKRSTRVVLGGRRTRAVATEALAPVLANGHGTAATIASAVLHARRHVAVNRPIVDIAIAVVRADGQINTFAIGDTVVALAIVPLTVAVLDASGHVAAVDGERNQ